MTKILKEVSKYIKQNTNIVSFKIPPVSVRYYPKTINEIYYLDENEYDELFFHDKNILKYSKNIMFLNFYSDDKTTILYKGKYFEISSFMGVYTFKNEDENLSKEYKEIYKILDDIGFHIYYYASSSDWNNQTNRFEVKDKTKDNFKKSRWFVKYESNLVSLNEQNIYLVEGTEDNDIKTKSTIYMFDLTLYDGNELKNVTTIFKNEILFNF